MEVYLIPHDCDWAESFLAASSTVIGALGCNAVEAHHIGSTAIPGILAKPIIDILIVIKEIHEVDECNPDMAEFDYEPMGEYGIAGRRYFRRNGSDGRRTHHVHIYERGSEQINRHVAFCEFLIAHPEWARRYSDLKRDLAQKFPDSKADYVSGKDAFIKNVDKIAALWIASRV